MMNTWGEAFDLQAMMREFADLKGEFLDMKVELLSIKDHLNSLSPADAPLQGRVLPRNRVKDL